MVNILGPAGFAWELKRKKRQEPSHKRRENCKIGKNNKHLDSTKFGLIDLNE